MKKLLLIIVYIIPFCVFSQQWERSNSNTTNDLNEIFFADSLTGYCVGDFGTIIKSTDGGVNWMPITSPTNKNIEIVHFLNKDEGYILEANSNSASGIFKTKDGGNTWEMINDSFPIPQRGTLNIELKSANFYFKDKFGVVNLSYSDYSPQTIPSINESWKTNDYGENWIKLDTNIDGYVFILDSLHWFTANFNFLKSNDGGLSWDTSKLFFGWPPTRYDTWHIFDTTGRGIIFHGYNQGISKLISFDSIDSSAQINRPLDMVYIDSLAYYLFSTGTESYLKRTMDDGITFLPKVDTTQYSLVGIDFISIDMGWACGNNGIILKMVSETDGVEKIILSNQINIFPNPVKEMIHLKVSGGLKINELNLYNIEGRLITNFKYNETSLDVSAETAGIYFLKITTKKGLIIKKIIIE